MKLVSAWPVSYIANKHKTHSLLNNNSAFALIVIHWLFQSIEYFHNRYYIIYQQKITGHDLQYTALIGKPSEITFRYAEHALTRESKKMGFSKPIKTMYLIG